MVHIVVSQHALLRGRERFSLTKRSVKRLAVYAYKNGLTQEDCRGPLKRYVDDLWMKEKDASNIRVYGDNIFLFAGNILVTLYQLPNELRRIANKLQQHGTKDIDTI